GERVDDGEGRALRIHVHLDRLVREVAREREPTELAGSLERLDDAPDDRAQIDPLPPKLDAVDGDAIQEQDVRGQARELFAAAANELDERALVVVERADRRTEEL